MREAQPTEPGDGRPAVAFLPWGDRFEDFHDKIGVTLEVFRDELTGTWLFNYVEALQAVGLRPVLYFFSARVPTVVRFTHGPTGAPVRFLPSPWLHRKLQGARDRFRIRSAAFRSVLAYASTPWRALAREMRRDGCTAMLCQEYEYPRFDGAVLAGRLLRIPVFATYQGGSATGSRLERPLRRVAIRRAAGLVIASRTEAQRVRSTYGVPSEHVAVVPNAFDVERWRPVEKAAVRSALDIPADTLVAVWQGRVEIDSKGLDVLVDAWQRLLADHPGTPLLLLTVGSAQDADAFRSLLTRLPAESVRWDDHWVLDRTLLWRYLCAADVAVLSSRREGFAVSLIEAMACGLPVVATDVSGVREALGDDPVGLIVPPEDADALAQALGQLLADEALRQDLGSRARHRAEAQFGLATVGAQLRDFIEERA